MKYHFSYLFLFAMRILALYGGESPRLSSLDQAILEKFFRELFTSSPAGYVLYGEKPVYLCNFPDDQYEIPGTERHCWAIETRQGIRVWKNLNYDSHQTNYYFHISDPLSNACSLDNEFLFINRTALENVINQNSLLFQSKLGQRFSIDSLFDKLLSPSDRISALFKGNTALLGIILGYGTKNALLYERGSSLIQQLSKKPTPPYQTELNIHDEEKMIETLNHSELKPGYNYKTIEEEVAELSRIEKPTSRLNKTFTKIGFSYDKNTTESEALLKMYLSSQERVENVLSSNFFLEKVLNKFGITITLVTRSKLSDRKKLLQDINLDFSKLPHLISQSILKLFMDLDSSGYIINANHFEDFITGMKKAEIKKALFKEDIFENHSKIILMDSNRTQLNMHPRFKQNLKNVHNFFENLSQQPNILCIYPKKLYFRVIKEGEGATLNNNSHKILAHFLVKDMKNNVLNASNKLAPIPVIDLSKVISGFRRCIIGMKRNEIREVFIHPDFAYGRYSEIGDGKVLCIQVELIDIVKESEEMVESELVPSDLFNSLLKIKTTEQVANLEKNYFEYCGFKVWMHYKTICNYLYEANGSTENIPTLLNIIDEIGKIKCKPMLKKNEKDILRNLHWLIYNKSEGVNKNPLQCFVSLLKDRMLTK